MQINLKILEANLRAWTRYATDTDNIGKVLPRELQNRRKTEGHLDGSWWRLRWLACSVMPSLNDHMLSDRDAHLDPRKLAFICERESRLFHHGQGGCSRGGGAT